MRLITMHLDCRNGTYHATLKIPKELRAILGKTSFRKSLKTKDKIIAMGKAAPLLTEWKALIETARLPKEQRLQEELLAQRIKLKSLERQLSNQSLSEVEHNDLSEHKEIIESEIEESILGSYGVNYPEQLSNNDLKQSQETYRLATGKLIYFNEYLEDYLKDSRIADKTKGMKRQQITEYSKLFPMLPDSNHQNTRSYIKRASKDFQLSNSSIKRNLSSLSVYFEYLRSDIQIIKDDVVNPFKGHRLPEVNRKEALEKKRKEFTVADIRQLEAELRQRALSNTADGLDIDMYDLFMVAIYSGARREELGQLKVNDYDAVNNTITIKDAKTNAGNRVVPIHPKLSLLFSKLTSASGSDYLFKSLTTDKYDNRTDALGKRFGRAKKKLGFDERYVFHSIRKTVATLLEQADVPENVCCDIVGHEKSATLSYGLYSGGTSLEQKRNAVDKIDYSFE